MPRDLPLGNGQLLVSFDRRYVLRDLFFPHVGLENHGMGRRHRAGVHADGQTSWIGDPAWELDLRYEDDTLVTAVRARSDTLGLEIAATDAVDWQRAILVRRFDVRNLRAGHRRIRLFLHHDLDVLETNVGITTFYDPPADAVIHYKRRRYFLVNLMVNGKAGTPLYSCDHRSSHGGRGSAGQIEDAGELNRNPITLGAVDSAVGAELELAGHGEGTLYAWICAGHRYQEVIAENAFVVERGPEGVIERTRTFWRSWSRKPSPVSEELPADLVPCYRRSLLIVRTQTDRGGGVLAANDSDTLDPGRETYSYVWPRDGAFIVEALDRAGYPDFARRFFVFSGSHISAAGYFLHRYHPDGSVASSWLPWVRDGQRVLPIQEDETALVLWALGRHQELHGDQEILTAHYSGLIRKAADFLCDFRNPKTGLPLPSWDLWEERFGVHAFTAATVVAGLRAAAQFAELFGDSAHAGRYRTAAGEVDAGIDRYLFHEELGRYVRTAIPSGDGYWLDTTPDASLAGIFLVGVRLPGHARMEATMQALAASLRVGTPIGGIARYEGDPYCRVEVPHRTTPGNPWFICTLWLAEWELARAGTDAELELGLEGLRWAAHRALPSGVMAEQLHPLTGGPESVSPLTWSHATFVSAACRYADRRRELRHAGEHASETRLRV